MRTPFCIKLIYCSPNKFVVEKTLLLVSEKQEKKPFYKN